MRRRTFFARIVGALMAPLPKPVTFDGNRDLLKKGNTAGVADSVSVLHFSDSSRSSGLDFSTISKDDVVTGRMYHGWVDLRVAENRRRLAGPQ